MSINRPCGRVGCKAEADAWPILCLLSPGAERGEHAPLHILIPLLVCPVHQAEFDPVGYSHHISDQIFALAMEARLALPDLGTAWVEWHDFSCPHWRQLQTEIAQSVGGGTA